MLTIPAQSMASLDGPSNAWAYLPKPGRSTDHLGLPNLS